MQDIEYLKSMYPAGIKMLQEYVSEACDRLDYDNSPMYDEFPDPMMVNRLCDTICDTVVSSEGIERIRSMWNIRETDQRAMEAEEISKNLEQLEEEESAEKKNPLIDDLALEPLETQELRFQEMQDMEWDGRSPMNPGPGRPPMNPGPGRPPMNTGPGRPPMNPGPGRPPMNPGPGRPPMNPGPGRPPMNPGPGRPPMNPGPGRPPMNPGPGRPPMNPGPGRPPMNPGPGRPPMNPGPGRPPRPVPPPPGPRPPWLRDIIKVLLLNEMFNRRCARGFCR